MADQSAEPPAVAPQSGSGASRVRQVTLVVKNMLRPPTFEDSVTLSTGARFLFDMMIEAAKAKRAFKVTATYFKGLGFMVDAMNELFGNSEPVQTWWEVLGGNGQRIPVGVSFYEPQDGEIVTFNFTQGGRALPPAVAPQSGIGASGVKQVTLVVKNMLGPDTFEHSVTLTTGARFLFDMMIEAAEANPAFKFTVTHFKGLGFFVNAMNELAGNHDQDQTAWQIRYADGQLTPGVSSCEPEDGETVTFSFTKRGSCTS